jgi:hypothetical protein
MSKPSSPVKFFDVDANDPKAPPRISKIRGVDLPAGVLFTPVTPPSLDDRQATLADSEQLSDESIEAIGRLFLWAEEASRDVKRT